MRKEDIQKALEELEKSSKRNFAQSYDLIINLKNLIIKQNPLNFFATLHYPIGRSLKIACFVDNQLENEANKFADLTIKESDFAKYKDKKAIKKLAIDYDYFIAQANLMPKVAATFGKVLGARGKMPNPKLGCVIPPNVNLEPLIKQLNSTVHFKARKSTNLQCMIGKEGKPVEEIIDNILTAYNSVIKNLPNHEQNIKNVLLKKSMGAPVKI